MNNPKNNRILSALPETEYQRLITHLELVQLPLEQILMEAQQECESVYFPLEGIVSLVLEMKNKSTTEIGLIGREGMVGGMQLLGEGICHSFSVVQVEGTAMRIEAKVLRAKLKQNRVLQKLMLRYALKLFNQVSQGAACNNHHSVKQRTARWLLMLDERSDSTLHMTQQLLSKMLGVRRTGISEVANQIKQQGIIEYQRGKITILDRNALEKLACECYELMRDRSGY